MMTIEQLLALLADQMNNSHQKLVTAESCTGGGLGYVLTSFPGSSAWYDRGFITYSNESKSQLLDVSELTLAKHGAVSEATAREMAEGALKKSEATISIAITGIAGPDGGSDDKPVGTVWIAWAKTNTPCTAECYHFSGERDMIRKQSIVKALEKLVGNQ